MPKPSKDLWATSWFPGVLLILAIGSALSVIITVIEYQKSSKTEATK